MTETIDRIRLKTVYTVILIDPEGEVRQASDVMYTSREVAQSICDFFRAYGKNPDLCYQVIEFRDLSISREVMI